MPEATRIWYVLYRRTCVSPTFLIVKTRVYNQRLLDKKCFLKTQPFQHFTAYGTLSVFTT